MMWHFGTSGFWMWLVMSMALLTLVAAVAVAVLFLSRLAEHGPRAPSAEEILDRKLAEGEIDDVEYHMRLAALATRVDRRHR
jgi:uncharacterized membrane protein